jgi:hypothetical protein
MTLTGELAGRHLESYCAYYVLEILKVKGHLEQEVDEMVKVKFTLEQTMKA